MASEVHERVQKYYGTRLQSSGDLQTSAACSLPRGRVAASTLDALALLHPEVCARYFGCAFVVPEKLQACKVLDLGSGSGRDCYLLSRLVGPSGWVVGLDMTEELVSAARKYIQYHQEKFGYEKPNTIFIQGYMERLDESGIRSDFFDVVVSNCVICLCPDKKAVLEEACRVLKDGGEFFFSDMYASKVIPENLKEDPVLWGEGMSGSLYWRDLIALAQEVGFSVPRLVTASHIIVHSSELLKKTGDITYASSTYRMFKLPKDIVKADAVVTYKGTVPECSDQLNFDASHTFKTEVPVLVDGETAVILQHSRFTLDFSVQSSDTSAPSQDPSSQYCHLNPFLLADKLGLSMKQCSKSGNERL
ncbi:arsenite methyltransferase [Scleropages formosus]|uniref:Arsenite methyltransferase n=1 Tax=Scleropages formosus TaxID=113540 RepID=A0A8C9RKA1_SCLFO|nr:arsenite methyltransferase-like [Scleropages formosus]XP_029111307.1 arsenite methyltransferase-like [Scleropages formosus]XP_029111308.1 arsenite methyltransferase-like [Scleropages formosus]